MIRNCFSLSHTVGLALLCAILATGVHAQDAADTPLPAESVEVADPGQNQTDDELPLNPSENQFEGTTVRSVTGVNTAGTEDADGFDGVVTEYDSAGRSTQTVDNCPESPSYVEAILVKYSDPAFDRYVDLGRLPMALAEEDGEMIVDVLLSLAEAERVLQRHHKSGVTADDILTKISAYIVRNADESTLGRLDRAASEEDREAWKQILTAAKEFASKSRAKVPKVRIDQLSTAEVMRMTATIHAIRMAELQGEATALDVMKGDIEDCEDLSNEEKRYLIGEIDSAKAYGENHPNVGLATSELMREFGSASRGVCTKCSGLGWYFRGFSRKTCDRCGGTGQVEEGGVGGFTGYKTNKFDLKSQQEHGGWTVAWADDIKETDVLEGVVSVGVSIYLENPAPFYQWIERLINRTINSLVSSAGRTFPNHIYSQVRSLAADVIREAIRGRSPRDVMRQYDTVDFKAGAIKYSGANYLLGQVVSTTWGMKPYIGFRWRPLGGGGNAGDGIGDYTAVVTIRNPTSNSISYSLTWQTPDLWQQKTVHAHSTNWHTAHNVHHCGIRFRDGGGPTDFRVYQLSYRTYPGKRTNTRWQDGEKYVLDWRNGRLDISRER